MLALLLALSSASADDPCSRVRFEVDAQTGQRVGRMETGPWNEPEGLAFDVTNAGGVTTLVLEMTRRDARAEALPLGFAVRLILQGEGAVPLATRVATPPVKESGGARWTARFEVPPADVQRLATTRIVAIEAPLPGKTVTWPLYGRGPVFIQMPFACYATLGG